MRKCQSDVVEIPVEDDPYFQYVPDKVGQNFSDLIASKFVDVQAVHLNENTLISEKGDPYDADTDEIGSDTSSGKTKRKVHSQK